ncbi:MAG: Re/Si-specific NAD(P)(+) transhydrogenase subunit alpha [Deltaproteobacteria bacterium]|nr:Re/Si-specific NAD(P)(+) transhydrogenase subunit alpha [Deltaproteobacteria bacterium]
MKIGILKERFPGELRVACVPETVGKLKLAGHDLLVERGAGDAASFPDAAYEHAGARVLSTEELYAEAELLVKVRRPSPEELPRFRRDQLLVAFLQPLEQPAAMQELARRGVVAVSLETIPRISRAQSMDALSSQANLAGYKAVLLAANALGKYFPLLMTAAGTAPPAKVLILGAGVAGLQAIATARRLGAVVSAYDTRAVVKEQVESLGATFVVLKSAADAAGEGGYARALTDAEQAAQRAELRTHIGASDVVITTALVPGRRAPVLLDPEAVAALKPGSVVVDLAGEQGGNCALSRPGETFTTDRGVNVLCPLNVPSSIPISASVMLSRNIAALLQHLLPKGQLALGFEDEITAGAVITHAGQVVHKATLERLGAAATA